VEVHFRTGLEDSTQQFTAVDVFDLENSKRYRRNGFILFCNRLADISYLRVYCKP